MFEKTNTTRARLLALAMAASIAALGVGCLDSDPYPDEVPTHVNAKQWIDDALVKIVNGQKAKLGDTLTTFLREHRAEACRVDPVKVRRQAGRQARDRIMHAHTQAELQGEQAAMSGHNQSKQLDLAPIVAFDEADRSESIDANLLPWQCSRPAKDVCLGPGGQQVVESIERRYFQESNTSRAAYAKVLNVLRDELDWGFSLIGADAGIEDVSATIDERCRHGESPLANYLKHAANDDDDRVASLARRLSQGDRCSAVTKMYEFLFKSIAIQLRAPRSEKNCTTQADP
jgi:hypothetical protein